MNELIAYRYITSLPGLSLKVGHHTYQIAYQEPHHAHHIQANDIIDAAKQLKDSIREHSHKAFNRHVA